MNYKRYVLDNGLRVLVAPMPAMRSVSCACLIAAGSRWERDEDAGIAHFTEHLLFKGTKRRPTSQAISETIERVGGLMNAATDKESTVYWTKTAADHIELSLDLISDMLMNSRLTPSQVERERGIIIEELNMTRDDPQDWVHGLVDESLWPNHPLGRDVAGTKESVSSIQRRRFLTFMNEMYGARNAVLVVAGGVKPGPILELAAEYFANWRPAQPREFIPAPSVDEGSRIAIDVRPTEQVHLCLAFPGVSRHDPRRQALDVLVTILGGSTSSRLFLEIRERRSLAYDVHMYTTKMVDAGSVVVYAGVDPRRAQETIDAIAGELERVRRRLVSEQELQKTKDYIKGRMYLGLEDTHAVASWLGAQELLNQNILLPEQVLAQIEAVTLDDMRRVARELFDPGLMHIAAVGPGVELLHQ